MTCPHLDYRARAGGSERDAAKSARSDEDIARPAFDEARAYCTAADQFVEAMRADVCNDRYDLSHDEDCEIYLDHADGDAAFGDCADRDGDAAFGDCADRDGDDGNVAGSDDGV